MLQRLNCCLMASSSFSCMQTASDPGMLRTRRPRPSHRHTVNWRALQHNRCSYGNCWAKTIDPSDPVSQLIITFNYSQSMDIQISRIYVFPYSGISYPLLASSASCQWIPLALILIQFVGMVTMAVNMVSLGKSAKIHRFTRCASDGLYKISIVCAFGSSITIDSLIALPITTFILPNSTSFLAQQSTWLTTFCSLPRSCFSHYHSWTLRIVTSHSCTRIVAMIIRACCEIVLL